MPGERPRHGRVGPADPHADPATDPGLRPVALPDDDGLTRPIDRVVPDAPTEPVPTAPDVPAEPPAPVVIERTRTGGFYAGMVLSALVLVLLLVFVLQNQDTIPVHFFGWETRAPAGVALLLAAVAGLLLVAIPGGLRIWQLRRVARRAGRGR